MLVFAIGFAHPLPPALPQAVAGAGNGTNRSAYIARRMAQATVAPIQLTTDGEAPCYYASAKGGNASREALRVAHGDLSGTGLGPYIRYQRYPSRPTQSVRQ